MQMHLPAYDPNIANISHIVFMHFIQVLLCVKSKLAEQLHSGEENLQSVLYSVRTLQA